MPSASAKNATNTLLYDKPQSVCESGTTKLQPLEHDRKKCRGRLAGRTSLPGSPSNVPSGCSNTGGNSEPGAEPCERHSPRSLHRRGRKRRGAGAHAFKAVSRPLPHCVSKPGGSARGRRTPHRQQEATRGSESTNSPPPGHTRSCGSEILCVHLSVSGGQAARWVGVTWGWRL